MCSSWPDAYRRLFEFSTGWHKHALLVPNINEASMCDRPNMTLDGVLYIMSRQPSFRNSVSKIDIKSTEHSKNKTLDLEILFWCSLTVANSLIATVEGEYYRTPNELGGNKDRERKGNIRLYVHRNH